MLELGVLLSASRFKLPDMRDLIGQLSLYDSNYIRIAILRLQPKVLTLQVAGLGFFLRELFLCSIENRGLVLQIGPKVIKRLL